MRRQPVHEREEQVGVDPQFSLRRSHLGIVDDDVDLFEQLPVYLEQAFQGVLGAELAVQHAVLHHGMYS